MVCRQSRHVGTDSVALAGPPPTHGSIVLREFRDDDVAFAHDLSTDPYVPHEWEHPDLVIRQVGRYPLDRWHEPATKLGLQHDPLRDDLRAELRRLTHMIEREPLP